MSTLNLEAIRNSLDKKSTDELIEIVKYSQDNYDREILPLIDSILFERSVSQEDLSAYKLHYSDLINDLANQPKLYKQAGFIIRLCQFILDHFIFFGICYGIQAQLIKSGPIDIGQYDSDTLAAYLLYFTITIGLFKGTIGMLIVGLSVVDKNKKPAGFGDGALRGFVMILNFLTLQLGHLWMLVDKKKRTLPDILSGTYVVYNK